MFAPDLPKMSIARAERSVALGIFDSASAVSRNSVSPSFNSPFAPVTDTPNLLYTSEYVATP